MKVSPKISIVTPSFNQGEFLDECIDSVLSQNYPNLEYIIMDGGSTDNSVEIIKKYEKYLTYWQSKPDSGQYAAINEGFKKTTGEIMAWLNSDDKYHPGSFWIVAQVFHYFPHIEWILGRPTAWDEKGLLDFVFDSLPQWSREKYLKRQFEESFIQQESTFWRRSLWEKTGAGLQTDLKYAADFELWARYFRFAQIYIVDALLGGFRYHSKQKTASCMEEYKREAHRVIDNEIGVFNNSADKTLLPAPKPLTIHDIVAKSNDKISTNNFSFFTYSKNPHFAYFKDNEQDLYGTKIDKTFCDLKVYQDLLVYTFIKDNIPKGSKILKIGGGDSRILRVINDDYECWNADKLEGLGSGPTSIETTGFRLVKDYIGNFNKEIPENYFDFVFSISALEHSPEDEATLRNICLDIDRVMKNNALSLHCFYIVIKDTSVWTNNLLPFFFQHIKTLHAFVPFQYLTVDPYTYVMSEQSYNAYWISVTKKSYEEFGKPLSYNVLWQKSDDTILKNKQIMIEKNLALSSEIAIESAEKKKFPLAHESKAIIATSIAPFDIEKQKAAIATWLTIGFKVVSFNCPEEIEQVHSYFPKVTFIPAKRDARPLTGKPLIFFDDILNFFTNSDISICGIVNSDIILKVDHEFMAFLKQETKNSMVVGCRVGVKNSDLQHGKIYIHGFDYFFFDRSIIECYPKNSFAIGAPWWDYWAVFVPLTKNIPVKQLIPPLGYHVDHPYKWSKRLWHTFAERIRDYITKQGIVLETEETLPGKDGPNLTLAYTVQKYIYKHCEFITQKSYTCVSADSQIELQFPDLVNLRNIAFTPEHKLIIDICEPYIRKCLERCPSFISASFTLSNLCVELGFKDKADDNILFGEGFYFHEGTGRWINKKGHLIISKLALALAKRYVISFELTCGRAVYYEHFPFDVQLNVKNAPPYRLTFNRGDQTQKVQLRIGKIDSDIHILIECNESFVPSHLGINNDNRQLSVHLSNLRIKPCT